MTELVVVEAARQLRFLQVRGNMLIRHLLETCLKKIYLLLNIPLGQRNHHYDEIRLARTSEDSHGAFAYLILAPCSAPASGSHFPILCDAELMTIKNITCWSVCHAGV